MKTLLILVLILFCQYSFAEDFPAGLYLEVTEIVDTLSGKVPVRVMIPVKDKVDALSKLPGVLADSFVGKPYESRLHYHYTDQPCTTEILP